MIRCMSAAMSASRSAVGAHATRSACAKNRPRPSRRTLTATIGAPVSNARVAGPDGTLAAVCESPLEQFPVGWLDGPTAAQSILARIDHVSQANVIRIKEISGIDPVAETILVDLVGKLDRAAWMLRAQEG